MFYLLNSQGKVIRNLSKTFTEEEMVDGLNIKECYYMFKPPSTEAQYVLKYCKCYSNEPERWVMFGSSGNEDIPSAVKAVGMLL